MSPEKRLEQVMQKLGVSRQELADSLGISLSSVAMYFTAQHRIRKVVALAVQSAYGVSAEWLMTGRGAVMVRDEKLSREASDVGRMYDRLAAQHRPLVRSLLQGFAKLKDSKG